MLENMPLCECGCGQNVKSKERKYLKGHYWKGRKRGKHTKEHNEKISKGVKLAYETEVVRNKHFINTPRGKNHPVYGTEGYWKNRHHTEESKQKSSNSQRGEKHHFYKKEHKKVTKEKTSASCKKWWNTIDGKKQRKIQSTKMKRGQAAYCNFFIKNPSKPQVALFNLCQEILPYPIMNYPYEGYSIDIATPKLNLAIEYDGSHWHQDKEYDKNRQKKLEDEGWKFLRYVDYVPSKKELTKDIENLLEMKGNK